VKPQGPFDWIPSPEDALEWMQDAYGTVTGNKKRGQARSRAQDKAVDIAKVVSELSGVSQGVRGVGPNASNLDRGLAMLSLAAFLGGQEAGVLGKALKPKYTYGLHVSDVPNLKKIKSSDNFFNESVKGGNYFWNLGEDLEKASRKFAKTGQAIKDEDKYRFYEKLLGAYQSLDEIAKAKKMTPIHREAMQGVVEQLANLSSSNPITRAEDWAQGFRNMARNFKALGAENLEDLENPTTYLTKTKSRNVKPDLNLSGKGNSVSSYSKKKLKVVDSTSSSSIEDMKKMLARNSRQRS
jgi:hypothetical protein